MSAHFTDLQQDGQRRWYNVVADRHWELEQVAKIYERPIQKFAGSSRVEVDVLLRKKMSFLEEKVVRRYTGYESIIRDDAIAMASGGGTSDYTQTRRVTDDERESRDYSTTTAPTASSTTRSGEQEDSGYKSSRTSYTTTIKAWSPRTSSSFGH